MAEPHDPLSAGDGPVVSIAEPVDDAAELLRSLQASLLLHPFASRAAIRSLVAEGRAFGETPEGRQWRKRLDRSPAMQKIRTLWEGLVFPLVAERAPAALPTAVLEDLLATISTSVPEAALARAFTER